MAFIEQEANEKAEEIDAKAEEEFNIEKGRLVQQQRLKIMEYYEKKEKQVELQKKIQSSNMLNQARLKVLKVREDHVSNVLDEARRRLGEITKDEGKYKEILMTLIIQGLFQIMEPNTVIKCRQVDQQLVQSLLAEASVEYKSKTGKDVVLKLENASFLGADTCGGVELSALNGRIRVNIFSLLSFLFSTTTHHPFSSVSLAGSQHFGIPFGVDLATTGARNPSGSVRPQS